MHIKINSLSFTEAVRCVDFSKQQGQIPVYPMFEFHFIFDLKLEQTASLSVGDYIRPRIYLLTTNGVYDTGALPETCGEFATMIEFDSSVNNLIERYADTLNSVLDNYKNNLYKEDLEMQIKYYEKYYSWNTRIVEWKNFLNYVRSQKEKN